MISSVSRRSDLLKTENQLHFVSFTPHNTDGQRTMISSVVKNDPLARRFISSDIVFSTKRMKTNQNSSKEMNSFHISTQWIAPKQKDPFQGERK